MGLPARASARLFTTSSPIPPPPRAEFSVQKGNEGNAKHNKGHIYGQPTTLRMWVCLKKSYPVPHFIHWFIKVFINMVILGLSPHFRQIQAQEPGWLPLRLSKTCHVFVEYLWAPLKKPRVPTSFSLYPYQK